MTAIDAEPKTLSFSDVMRRRRTVAIVTFVILAVLSVALVIIHGVKYGAISHVLLVNDESGRDPAVAGVDMPTIITGSTVLLDVRQQLGLSETVNGLRRAVDARVAPKSSLMTISVEDHNPDLAMKINNTLADTFSRFYWHLAGSRYDDVTDRLRRDVNASRERLHALSRQLEAASAGASYVGSQASLDSSASHLGELEESRGVAFGQYTDDRLNLQAHLGEPGKLSKVFRYEMLKNNTPYLTTDQLVGKDLAQYLTTRAAANDNYPGMAGFRDKIAKEQDALNVLRTKALNGRDAYSPSQAGNVVQTARDFSAVHADEAKLAAYDKQINDLHQRLSHPQVTGSSIGALRAERDAAEAQFNSLTLALSAAEARSAEAASVGQVVIVDRATEALPTLLRPLFLVPLALIASALLAIAAAYLAEQLVPRLFGERDVEVVYGRPILATLRTS